MVRETSGPRFPAKQGIDGILRDAVATAAIASTLIIGAASASADSCPNAQLRTGPSAGLPDCRAYEEVSPADSGDILQDPVLSSVSGNAVGYASLAGFAGTPSSGLPNAYASSRGAAAWQTTALNPPYSSTASLDPPFEFGSSGDFARTLVFTTAKLAPDAVEGNANLYVHDSSDSSYAFVGTVPDPSAGFNLNIDYAGAASDGSHFVFSTFQPYMFESTPATPSSVAREVYDWSGGQLHLVGILPDGSVDPNGAFAAGPPSSHAVSDDGSRIYWQDAPSFGVGALYLREGGQTVLVSERQSDGSAQSAQFWHAARDGSKAYLTSEGRLTGDASPTANDLYQYDAGSAKLVDLTPDSTDPNGASVEFVLGTSDDGSYVYFIAFGALAAGAVSGSPNVYAWHDGTTRLVGTLANAAGSSPNSRVSPDGRYLGFVFSDQISGPHPQNAQPFDEAYLYDYQDDSLVCASCLPNGLQPTGDVRLQEDSFFRDSFEAFKAGASRNVSDGGRFFFESPDALVPTDTNGKLDVYEYQAGQVHLISTGRADTDSFFGDASASGNDVFLTTRERLVGQDQDDNYDLYDARVSGGLAAQNPPSSGPPCQGATCQTGSFAPGAPLAASISFGGPGNLPSSPPQARMGKVKVVKKTVKGSRFYLSIKVPGRGRITISGASLKKVSRAVSKPGTYRLTVTLTAKAKKLLNRRQKLFVKVRVRYVPAAGRSSSATVSMTVKR